MFLGVSDTIVNCGFGDPQGIKTVLIRKEVCNELPRTQNSWPRTRGLYLRSEEGKSTEARMLQISKMHYLIPLP